MYLYVFWTFQFLLQAIEMFKFWDFGWFSKLFRSSPKAIKTSPGFWRTPYFCDDLLSSKVWIEFLLFSFYISKLNIPGGWYWRWGKHRTVVQYIPNSMPGFKRWFGCNMIWLFCFFHTVRRAVRIENIIFHAFNVHVKEIIEIFGSIHTEWLPFPGGNRCFISNDSIFPTFFLSKDTLNLKNTIYLWRKNTNT